MTNVTPQENVNAFAVYDIKKIVLNASPEHVSQKQNNQVVTQINYGSNIDIIASAVTGKYISSMLIDNTEKITDTQTDENTVTLTIVKEAPVIVISYTDDVYKLSKGSYSNGSMTFAGNVSTIGYNQTVEVTFKPNNDYYLKSVSVTDGAGTVSDLTISGQQTKLITSSTDLKNGNDITVTPTFDLFKYKLVNGTLTKCTATTLDSATCGTTYDVSITPSAGYHIVGEATIDMNQSLTNGTADGDGMKYKWTPTLTYTDGTPNNLVSGTTKIEINASCVADQYPLTITATDGDNDANKSFKVQRTSDNTIGGTDSKKGEIQNGGNLYYNDNIQLTYTPDTDKYHVKEGPTLSVGDSPVALSGSDGAKTYTLSDYAHNTRVNASITYTANTYTLNWTNDANGNGSVSVKNGSTPITSGSTISANKTYTITATPTKATHGTENVDIATLTSLTIDGSIISSGDTYTPSGANSGSKTVKAEFSPIMKSVTGKTGTGIKSVTPSAYSVQVSNTVTFTAKAETGYYLESIYGDSKTYTQANDVSTLVSGAITIWDNTEVGYGSKDYPVVAKIKQFSVSIDSITGGTVTANPSLVNYGSATTITADASTGYYISKYNSSVISGHKTKKLNTWKPTITSAMNITSSHIAFDNKYDVKTSGTFAHGSVTVDDDKKSVAYNTKSKITINATETGYYIKSYGSNNTNSHELTEVIWEPTITDDMTITTSDIAFDNKYDVSFVVVGQKGAGDGVSDDKKTVEYNTSLGENMPTNPTAIEGYTFNGWNTKKDGSGSIFTSTDKVTSDNVVYAKYTEWGFEFNDDNKTVTRNADKNWVVVTVSNEQFNQYLYDSASGTFNMTIVVTLLKTGTIHTEASAELNTESGRVSMAVMISDSVSESKNITESDLISKVAYHQWK